MKRSLVLLFSMVLLLVGCKKEETIDNPNAKSYTSEDIYILSYTNGYVDNDRRYDNMVIENEEQLAYARERSLILPTDEMVEQYPLSEYIYVIDYDSVSSGGYYLKAESLCIGDNYMYFEYTDDSHTPQGDSAPSVMGGFLHMAAVPKEYLGDTKYIGWTYPDRNDMYQNEDYYAVCKMGVTGDESLREIYGDTCYLIRSEEELERFLKKSQTIVDIAGNPFLVAGTLSNRDNSYKLPDFEEVALLVQFFPGDGSYSCSVDKMVRVEDGQIILNTQVQDEVAQNGEPQGSSVFYAHIPKEFLTEESYEGWVTP